MHKPGNQRGLTFVSLIFILVVAGSILLVALKVMPIYLESFQVDSALKNIVSQPQAANLSKAEIYDRFLRHMEVNEIRRFSEKDLKEMMKIKRERDQITINMNYSSRRPVFSNLSVVADWNKEFSSSDGK